LRSKWPTKLHSNKIAFRLHLQSLVAVLLRRPSVNVTEIVVTASALTETAAIEIVVTANALTEIVAKEIAAIESVRLKSNASALRSRNQRSVSPLLVWACATTEKRLKKLAQ
jgi:hypothetical protein